MAAYICRRFIPTTAFLVQNGGRRPSWIFKNSILTGYGSKVNMRYCAKFRGDQK